MWLFVVRFWVLVEGYVEGWGGGIYCGGCICFGIFLSRKKTGRAPKREKGGPEELWQAVSLFITKGVLCEKKEKESSARISHLAWKGG